MMRNSFRTKARELINDGTFTPSEQIRTIESLRSERLPEYRFQFPSGVKLTNASNHGRPAGSARSLRRNVHDRGWKATDHIRIETHEQDEVRCAGGCDDA